MEFMDNSSFPVSHKESSSGIKAESMNVDRINELPDDVLCYIVSFLGLKDAVETSLISHRWRHLWKHLILTSPNLEFDIANMYGTKYYAQHFENKVVCLSLGECEFKRRDFIKRVHEFLRLYSGNKVDTFKVAFHLNGEHAAVLDEWIRFAIEKGAQVLDIQLDFIFWGYPPGDEKSYEFPHQLLLSNSSLKHLSLHKCVLKPPSDHSDHFDKFKQLTTLVLRHVRSDQNFTACLFSNCLFLERLTLSDCWVGSYLIITGHPRLTDLRVLRCGLKKLEISAANLVSLEHDDVYYEMDISCIKTPRLSSLFLCSDFAQRFNGLAQFASCPRLESLYLSMNRNSAKIPPIISTFRNLKQMSLVLPFRLQDFQLGSVVNILKATPLLEELEIMIPGSCNQVLDMSKFSGFVHNHLRKVQIRCFNGTLCDIELAILILKMATKLEKMVIDPLGKLYLGDGRWEVMDPYYCWEDKYGQSHKDWKVDVDGIPRLWKKKGKARIQEKLEVVETDAQVIIL